MWPNQAIFSSVDVFCTLMLSHLCFSLSNCLFFFPNCLFRKRFLLIASTDYKPTQSHPIWEMIIFDYLWVCGSINSWKFEALLCFPPEPSHTSLSLSPSMCYHCSLHKLRTSEEINDTLSVEITSVSTAPEISSLINIFMSPALYSTNAISRCRSRWPKTLKTHWLIL